jgi:hypothetical protein
MVEKGWKNGLFGHVAVSGEGLAENFPFFAFLPLTGF